MEVTEEMLARAVVKGILIAIEEGKLKFKDANEEKREAFGERLRSNPELVEKILADKRELKNVVNVIRTALK